MSKDVTEFIEFHEDAWGKLPVELKTKCVEHLRPKLPPETIDYIKDMHEEYGPFLWATQDQTPPDARDALTKQYGFYVATPFHMSAGMTVRNVLRQVVKDEELPPIPYEPDGELYRNWDDFYVGVIEAAVGVRAL